jgi:hypothetical protein
LLKSAPSGHLIHWLQVFPKCLKIPRAIQIRKFVLVESHNADKFFLRDIVPDLGSRIRDVVLVRCIFGSGKPQGVGILEWGGGEEGMEGGDLFFIMYFSLPKNIPPHPLGGTRVRKHWRAVYYFISYYSTTLSTYHVMMTVCLYWYD